MPEECVAKAYRNIYRLKSNRDTITKNGEKYIEKNNR